MRTSTTPPGAPSSRARKPSSQRMYLSNIGSLPEKSGEHGVLAADLLDAVHRERVLDVPVALVLAGQVAVEAALDEHRDDLVVRNGVLGALVGHLVELRLDVPDERHVLEHRARVGPDVVGGLAGQ